MAIQDGSGGIAVRVPLGYPSDTLARGAIVTVSGALADPYGNLEVRPTEPAQIVLIGSGGLPEPVVLDSAHVAEAREGSLAVITATLVDIDRYSSGALSLSVRDDRGAARVYAFAEANLDPASLVRGQRIRATGIVGQRASRSGASDGHRLWLRGQADLVVVDDGASPTPPPDGTPGDEPGDARPTRVSIRKATPGRTVTIDGVVTSVAGLIDSEGRRVTVQDRSGAILVRYPDGAKPANVGRVIRATGEVGTWYGGNQLEAASTPRLKGRLPVVPTNLRRPPAEADEWRLVSVSVRIIDVERDGDTWRAEAEFTSGEALPIVGLAGSGIDADRIEEGRMARISGIVRRAHPSANDQRFSIAPRSGKDIKLGRLLLAAASSDETGDADGGGSGDVYLAAIATADDGSAVLTATLGSLDALTDRVVRVGGRIDTIEGRRLTLDDGTAQGTVRFADDVVAVEPVLRVGEVINATGRVRSRAGGPEVLVETAADVSRAARAGTPSSDQTASPPSLSGEAGSALVRDPAGVLDAPVLLAATAPWTAEVDQLPLLVTVGLTLTSLAFIASAALLSWRTRRSLVPPSSPPTLG